MKEKLQQRYLHESVVSRDISLELNSSALLKASARFSGKYLYIISKGKLHTSSLPLVF